MYRVRIGEQVPLCFKCFQLSLCASAWSSQKRGNRLEIPFMPSGLAQLISVQGYWKRKGTWCCQGDSMPVNSLCTNTDEGQLPHRLISSHSTQIKMLTRCC